MIELMEMLSQDTLGDHPCLTCGACCASFRVSFYWREAEPDEHQDAVPALYWEDTTPTYRAMKGTSTKHHPKCMALRGRIGDRVSCAIYTQRPSTCRAFEASYEHGVHNEKCDRAREKHGLKPLTKSHWGRFRGT